MEKGSIVTIVKEFSDTDDDGKFVLLENPDGGRVKIKSINSRLMLPSVEVVKVEWLKLYSKHCNLN